MEKNIRRVMAMLMSVAMVICLAVPAVYAEGTSKKNLAFNDYYDGTGSTDAADACSLAITAGDKLPDRGKITVKLYKVADASAEQGHIVYKQTELFNYKTTEEKYLSEEPSSDGSRYNKWVGNVDLSSAYDSEWASRAVTLAGYTSKKGFFEIGSEDGIAWSDVIDLSSDKKTITFTSLSRGLYLVVSDNMYVGSRTYEFSPMLICLPSKDSSEEWKADWNITLSKFRNYSDGGDSTTKSISVVKKWEDEGQESDRPASITVELLRDGKVYDTKVLNASNSWRHTWTGLAKGNHWELNEVVSGSDKYTVIKENEGDSYILTNTHSTDIPDPDTPLDPGPGPEGGDTPPTDILDPDVPLSPAEPPVDIEEPDVPANAVSLPQTGQLWWPVPVLALAGIAVFSFGWIRSRKNAEDKK